MKHDLRVFAKFARRVLFFCDQLAACVLAALSCTVPLTMMDGLKGLTFWKATGYYGVFLIGAAAVFRALRPGATRD